MGKGVSIALPGQGDPELGVAMGNAVQATTDAAVFIAPTMEENGIVPVFEELVPV